MNHFIERLPAVCCLSAAMLLFAVVTEGFSVHWDTGRPFLLFLQKVVAVEWGFAVLTGIGLSICRARTRRQAVGIVLTTVLITAIWTGVELYRLLSVAHQPDIVTRVDLSHHLPCFVLALVGTQILCRACRRAVLLDFAAFGLSFLIFWLPTLLFGWGISSCFFDTICMTTTLFALLGVDLVRDALPLCAQRRTHKR